MDWLKVNAATLAVLITIIGGAFWFGGEVGTIQTQVSTMTGQIETLNKSVETINPNLGNLTASVNENSLAIATLGSSSMTDASIWDDDPLLTLLRDMQNDLMDIKAVLIDRE